MDKKTYDVTRFERPSVTTDIVIFTIINETLKVLLVKRGEWPFKNYYALPGGFVRMTETLDQGAERELREETGVTDVYLEQLYTFGDVKRDPRTRVISVAYMALVDTEKVKLHASTDVIEAKWFDLSKIPKLAFDHDKIINFAKQRLRAKLSYSNIAFTLLPKYFTLTQAQQVYEIILGHDLDKRNFRKKLASLERIKETKQMQIGAHRPARLYTTSEKNFELKVFD
jgi:8-oxo-dGTP diphosphatase